MLLTHVTVCYSGARLYLIRCVCIAYTTEQLETNAASLRELPGIEKRKRQHNKKEAIKLLGKDIAALRKRGYTLEQVSEVQRGKGLDITERTLRNYLQQRKRPVKKAPVIREPPPRRPGSQARVI